VSYQSWCSSAGAAAAVVMVKVYSVACYTCYVLPTLCWRMLHLLGVLLQPRVQRPGPLATQAAAMAISGAVAGAWEVLNVVYVVSTCICPHLDLRAPSSVALERRSPRLLTSAEREHASSGWCSHTNYHLVQITQARGRPAFVP
jgi:hypothetical protein